jgi:hypothetical protein
LQLDSLYAKFIQLRAPELFPQTYQPAEFSLADRKCSFGIRNQIKLNFNHFTLEQQNVLRSLLLRKVKQKSMVSPSGFFRIHYDTIGTQTPVYDPSLTTEENVYQVALAADSAYRFEVNFLGFPKPPSDNGEGGDDRYDIYITTADGNYGFTASETPLGNDKFTSYMEIHFNFQGSGFATHGLNAMKVTVAHEFHHSIQMGNYILRLEDRYFYELTSTSMEEFVYDDVNDYYAYLDSYFSHADKAFPDHIGYDMAIWNIFLVKNFDYGILKEQWERMPVQRAIYAISNSLVFRGTSFDKENNKFGIWTYYTGMRAVPGLYFEEAENYPLIKPLVTITYPQYTYAEVDAQATSNNFIKFGNTSNGDSLYAIVTNGDVSAVINKPQPTFGFIYTLFSDALSGDRKLTDNYSANFNAPNVSVWSISEILNDIVVLEDTTRKQTSGETSYAYPNPFNYKSYFLSEPLIFFPFESELGQSVDLNIYSVGMQLMFNSEINIQNLPGDRRGVSWDGLDIDGNKLTSGVYIYVIKRGDEVVKGKVVIFNE